MTILLIKRIQENAGHKKPTRGTGSGSEIRSPRQPRRRTTHRHRKKKELRFSLAHSLPDASNRHPGCITAKPSNRERDPRIPLSPPRKEQRKASPAAMSGNRNAAAAQPLPVSAENSLGFAAV